jgi:hypothetical protein
MPQNEGLFPPDTWVKHRHEIAADRAIRHRYETGEWTANEHGAAASNLRGIARAADLAEYAMTTERSPYSIGVAGGAHRELRETLIAYGLAPGGVAANDPFTDFLESLDRDPASEDHRPPP